MCHHLRYDELFNPLIVFDEYACHKEMITSGIITILKTNTLKIDIFVQNGIFISFIRIKILMSNNFLNF